MDDPRFRHVSTDPRFKTVPRRKRKVSIDPRFKSMFTDESFQVKYKTDKRGSAVNQSSSEDLRKYYDIQTIANDDDKEEERESVEEGLEESGRAEESGDDAEEAQGEEPEEEEEEEEESESGLDSDASSTDIEDEELLGTVTKDGVFSQWLDEAEGVPQSESTGYRLALCNMNWDRLNAVDLYVLFNSFKPTVGMVKSVSIYPSDYGRERLQEEERTGPTELVSSDNPHLDDGDDPTLSEDREGSGYHDKLREYQLKRLSYYYAIIECDSAATAEHIYKECDGLEFELSSSTLDLRFVPDDMTFTDHEPSSTATESSLTKDYQPPEFMTTALQQSKVELTWDETNPSRLKKTMKQYKVEDLNNIDFDTYLGSSSDDEQKATSEDSIKKYRSLLGLQDDGNDLKKEEEEEEELEITWNIGLRDSKKSAKDPSTVSDGEDKGFDDPFFSDKKSSKKKKKKLTPEEEKQAQKEKEDLELLVLSDTEDTKEHFSLKQIMKEEKKESAKQKRKRRKEKSKASSAVNDFEVDLNDPRFSALYESHHYAIEPSSHQYKATKGMKKLLNERQKRRKIDPEADKKVEKSQHEDTGISPSSSNLQTLVKSVKAKANTLNKRHQILMKRRKIRSKT